MQTAPLPVFAQAVPATHWVSMVQLWPALVEPAMRQPIMLVIGSTEHFWPALPPTCGTSVQVPPPSLPPVPPVPPEPPVTSGNTIRSLGPSVTLLEEPQAASTNPQARSRLSLVVIGSS